MRGALFRNLLPILPPRIIPADAGSTYMNQNTENSYEDHPRGCGEHVIVAIGAVVGAGSSPRMRGALRGPLDIFVVPGIIPADAGSTGVSRITRRNGKDHPYASREHTTRRGCM